MRTFLVFVFTGIIVLGSSGYIAAQAPPIQWQRSLGGSMGDDAKSIHQMADGGHIIAGYSSSLDGNVLDVHGTQLDYWIVKTDASGSIQWQKALGGTSSELGVSIAATYDNGYIVTGYSFSADGDVTGNHGNCDYWVVKLDDTGAIQWQRSLGGSNIDISVSIRQTYDSGYIAVGRSFSNDGDVTGAHDSAECWIVKLSATGATQWQKCLGGSRGDGAYDVQQTLDTGFVVACVSSSVNGDVTGNHGDYDAWIVKLSATGVLLWQQSLGGTGTDYAAAIIQTRDTGYVVAGSSNSANGDVTLNHGGFDYWIIKLSSSGAIQWQKSFGGSADEYAYSVKSTFDGGYVVAGTTFSGNDDVWGTYGFSDMWIVKLSSSGELDWQRSLGGSSYDNAACIEQTADSGYIVAGSSMSDDICVTGNHGSNDYWIVKLKDTTHIAGLETLNVNKNDELSVMPNPAGNHIDIAFSGTIHDVKITDLLGRVVYKGDPNATHAGIDIASLLPGMHIITVNNVTTVRFLKLP